MERLKRELLDRRDDDVYLNQPGRALTRSILWWLLSTTFALFPLGLGVSLVAARVPSVESWGKSLVSTMWTLPVFLIPSIIIAFAVALPVLVASKLPRVTSKDAK